MSYRGIASLNAIQLRSLRTSFKKTYERKLERTRQNTQKLMEHIFKTFHVIHQTPTKTSNLASRSQTPHPPRWSLHPSNSAQQYVDIPRSKPPSSVGPNPQEAGAPSLPRLPDLRTSPPKKICGKLQGLYSCDVYPCFFYVLDVNWM